MYGEMCTHNKQNLQTQKNCKLNSNWLSNADWEWTNEITEITTHIQAKKKKKNTDLIYEILTSSSIYRMKCNFFSNRNFRKNWTSSDQNNKSCFLKVTESNAIEMVISWNCSNRRINSFLYPFLPKTKWLKHYVPHEFYQFKCCLSNNNKQNQILSFFPFL